MLYKGKKLETPKEQVVVIPHGDTNVVFKAKMVRDFTLFESLCKVPAPKIIAYPDGRSELVEDASFKDDVRKYDELHWNYRIISSLCGDIAFETVNINDPSTYSNWKKELEDDGFSPIEISRVIRLVLDANGLNSAKIDEATASFLAGHLQV